MKLLSFFITILITFIACGKHQTCKGVEFNGTRSFKNNKPFTGKCITHHNNSNLKSIQSYSDGFDHGEWIFYFNDGTIETEGAFKKGEKVGIWKYYYRNGKLKNVSEYSKKGILVKSENFDSIY